MKRLKKHPLRLKTNHPRYPHEMVFKDGEENANCKYCKRTPLVKDWDFKRTRDGKDEFCCHECMDAGRGSETALDSLGRIGSILSGIEEHHFPWAPEKGTPREKYAGKCATCGEAVFANPYTKRYIGAYWEHLRGILVHEKCGVPKRQAEAPVPAPVEGAGG